MTSESTDECILPTQQQKDAFNEEGFVIVRSFLSKAELSRLKSFFENSHNTIDKSVARDDGTGKMAHLTVWNHPGDDVPGMVARCQKTVDFFEEFLGGEVYHYHSKVIRKEPRVGGAFVWHQDYGYWYENGNLFPDMGTAFIAIDKATEENGCLKVLRGSHRAGRIEHKTIGGQVQADPERVAHLERVCPITSLCMEEGDVCFFHCNLLHRSDQNLSDKRRWALAIAYNRASNDPIKDHYHARYTPLHKVPNSAILTCSEEEDVEEKKWFFGTKEMEGLEEMLEEKTQ